MAFSFFLFMFFFWLLIYLNYLIWWKKTHQHGWLTYDLTTKKKGNWERILWSRRSRTGKKSLRRIRYQYIIKLERPISVCWSTFDCFLFLDSHHHMVQWAYQVWLTFLVVVITVVDFKNFILKFWFSRNAVLVVNITYICSFGLVSSANNNIFHPNLFLLSIQNKFDSVLLNRSSLINAVYPMRSYSMRSSINLFSIINAFT